MCTVSIMNKLAVAVAVLVLTPALALVALLPDWGGVIYESPAAISQGLHA